MNIFQSSLQFLSNNGAIIGTVLGIVFTIAKGVSNGSAGPVVAKFQSAVDFVAVLVESLGKLLKGISDILGNLIRSDGLMGKK